MASILLDIRSLALGDDVQHPLLVAAIVMHGGPKARTVLTFSNRSGRIESAPLWPGPATDEMIRGLRQGALVQVLGRISSYRDTLQLDVQSLRPLPRGSVAMADLVPSVGPVDRYWQFIDDSRDRITAPRLRGVVDLFYADDNFRGRYEECPGSPGIGHHALLGGLLQHTCEVVAIARQLARVAHADEAVATAGALLHDIGKIESYRWDDGVFGFTERGRLIGHVVQGVIMLRQALDRASPAPCTADEHLLLEHMILAHHGEHQFGSPVRPMTLEAEVLHVADNASARTASISDAYRDDSLFAEGERLSNKRVWQLERWLFRHDMDFGRESGGGESGER